MWPGKNRFNLYITGCASPDEKDAYENGYYKEEYENQEDCNVLKPKYLKKLHDVYCDSKAVVVNGNDIFDKLKAGEAISGSSQPPVEDEDDIKKYKGKWVFDWNPDKGYTAANGYQRRCKMRGPTCSEGTIFEILGANTCSDNERANWWTGKTEADILALVNAWRTNPNVKQSTLER